MSSTPSSSSDSGVPAVSAALTSRTRYAIGIDIGGTKINAARIAMNTDQKEVFSFHDDVRISTPRTSSEFMAALVELVGQLVGDEEQPVESIGISTAGIVDPIEGKILGSTGNLPAVDHHPYDISGPLVQQFGLPVYVENDANAACYGEYKVGAARGHRHVVMATLGTGVGTGLIFDGRLYHGGRYSAGEGGHITVSMDNSRLCTTGLYDAWESYASGPGLAESARRMVAVDPNTPEAIDLIGDEPVESVTTHQVIHAWKSGNGLAKLIMEEWHRHIAAGLGGLINLLDPEVSVIGGGMAQFVDFELLRDCLKERVMNCPIPELRVVSATLGNHAGMIGAAYLAQEQVNG